jgi:hypothetical protein
MENLETKPKASAKANATQKRISKHRMSDTMETINFQIKKEPIHNKMEKPNLKILLNETRDLQQAIDTQNKILRQQNKILSRLYQLTSESSFPPLLEIAAFLKETNNTHRTKTKRKAVESAFRATLQKQASNRYCKPCNLIENQDSQFNPHILLPLSVFKKFTVSKKEAQLWSEKEQNRLVQEKIRIMKCNQNRFWIVAKDICLSLHIRSRNVAKTIGNYENSEKAQMKVRCPRRNGSTAVHVLIVLSFQGVSRLFQSSRNPKAPFIKQWFNEKIKSIST